jgi:hypothetical protein
VIAFVRQRRDLLIQVHGLTKLRRLFPQVFHQITGQHLGKTANVEDVFFRIQGRELAAGLTQCVDHLRLRSSHARVEERKETRGPRANDRDVSYFVRLHDRKLHTTRALRLGA